MLAVVLVAGTLATVLAAPIPREWPCNIDVVEDLSEEEFEAVYREQKPVIIRPKGARELSQAKLSKLLHVLGDSKIYAACTHDFPMTYGRSATIREVFEGGIRHRLLSEPRNCSAPQVVRGSQRATTTSAALNATAHLFGCPLSEAYEWSDDEDYMFDGQTVELVAALKEFAVTPEVLHRVHQESFCRARVVGLGAGTTGLPWHFHGSVSGNQVLYGRKVWAVTPEVMNGGFNPRRTSWSWWVDQFWTRHMSAPEGTDPLQTLQSFANKGTKMYMCEQKPGEFVYLPAGWYHTTMNTEATVMIVHACGASTVERPSAPGADDHVWFSRSIRESLFTSFPVRTPLPGFTEGLPWSSPMSWPGGTQGLDMAGGLADALVNDPWNGHEPMLSFMLGSGMLGRVLSAVHSARELLMRPSVEFPDTTLPEWSELHHSWEEGRGMYSTHPPFWQWQRWLDHSSVREDALSTAACDLLGSCQRLTGGGLVGSRFQELPVRARDTTIPPGEAPAVLAEQHATILASTMEVGCVNPRDHRDALAWTAFMLRNPKAYPPGATQFALVLRAALTRPADEEDEAIADLAHRSTVSPWKTEPLPWTLSDCDRGLESCPQPASPPPKWEQPSLWRSLRLVAESAERWLSQATAQNPLNADFHAAYGAVLSVLGFREQAVAALTQAMALHPYDVTSCVRLARVFLRSAWDGAVRYGPQDRGYMRETLEADPENVPSLGAWILRHERWGTVYRRVVNESRTLPGRTPLGDMLAEGLTSRGGLPAFGPLGTYGLSGDLAIARRVCGECLIRAGRVLESGRSADQNMIATSEAYELATLARAFGVQRSTTVKSVIAWLNWHPGESPLHRRTRDIEGGTGGREKEVFRLLDPFPYTLPEQNAVPVAATDVLEGDEVLEELDEAFFDEFE
jgi:hypothetical protein